MTAIVDYGVGNLFSLISSLQKIGEEAVVTADAAVLAALNIADELFKAQEASENLRRQVKTYLDEAAQAKNEVSELKRQLFKAQNKR